MVSGFQLNGQYMNQWLNSGTGSPSERPLQRNVSSNICGEENKGTEITGYFPQNTGIETKTHVILYLTSNIPLENLT